MSLLSKLLSRNQNVRNNKNNTDCNGTVRDTSIINKNVLVIRSSKLVYHIDISNDDARSDDELILILVSTLLNRNKDYDDGDKLIQSSIILPNLSIHNCAVRNEDDNRINTLVSTIPVS